MNHVVSRQPYSCRSSRVNRAIAVILVGQVIHSATADIWTGHPSFYPLQLSFKLQASIFHVIRSSIPQSVIHHGLNNKPSTKKHIDGILILIAKRSNNIDVSRFCLLILSDHPLLTTSAFSQVHHTCFSRILTGQPRNRTLVGGLLRNIFYLLYISVYVLDCY